MEDIYDNNINHEVNRIIINEWQFLNNNWPMMYNNKYKHRTELKNIEYRIN